MMHFPPVFEKNFYFLGNFWNFTFSRQNFIFSSVKISDDLFFLFFQNFRIPPVLPVLLHFPPDSRKFIIPLLFKIPPCFRKIQQLFTYFTCNFFPPYFDHDAFMHHPMYYWTPLFWGFEPVNPPLNMPTELRIFHWLWQVNESEHVCRWPLKY